MFARKICLPVVLVVLTLVLCNGAVAQNNVIEIKAGEADDQLIPPPAVNLPNGGLVITEMNFADEDVLGIIKQVIETAPEVIEDSLNDMFEMAKEENGDGMGMGMGKVGMIHTMLGEMDTELLRETFKDLKAVRVLLVKYPDGLQQDTVIDVLSAGVAKTGKFRKIFHDIGLSDGFAAAYAEEKGQSYVFYVSPDKKLNKLVAARVVGKVDVKSLIKWLGGAGKMFFMGMSAISSTPVDIMGPAGDIDMAEVEIDIENGPEDDGTIMDNNGTDDNSDGSDDNKNVISKDEN